MHGLQSILSINEVAARHEWNRKLRTLLDAGQVVLYKTDTLGFTDINEPPRGFDTVALAQQSLIGKGAFYKIHK